MARTRRSWRRWGAATVAVAAAAIVPLTAIGGGAQADESTDPAIFKVGVLQDVDNLNPFKGITAAAYEVWALEYDTLTGYSSEDFSPTPRLAESWDKSTDGLTWTYHIRQGVNFTDGTPMTANDVAYTFNRVMDGQIEKTNYGSYVKNIDSVKATDDYTVVMKISAPSAIMEHLLVPILPEHIWKNISEEDLKTYTNEPTSDPPGGVGTGAFIMTEAREGQYYTFKTNEDYWDGPAHIDGVQYILYQNVDGMVAALKNGEIDFADDIDAAPFEALQNQDNIVARSSQYYGFSYITFNGGAQLVDGTPIGTGHPSLEDPKVRLAINWAIDKQALVDRTLNGRGEPGTTIIPPIYADIHAEPTDVIGYDPDKANQILDDAGYARGPDGIRTMPDGTDPLVYQLYSRQNSETSKTTIRFLQGWLKAIGIDSTAQSVSENRLYEIAGDGTYDMYEWGWIVEPDPDYQLSTFTCGQQSYKTSSGTIYAGLNDAFYCNKQYDKLYKEQAVTVDPAARAEIVKKMQLMAYDANAYIVYEYYDYLQAYRSDRFTGFVPQPSPDGAILFQYGTYSYMNIEPVSAANGGTSSSSDSNAPLIIGGLAAAAVLAGVVVWLVSRGRRSTDADVE
ncbi:MAG TPA: ABC transporter substrate-binding protein [Actinomycetes bacterium]|nr:ABC transporter substrate-binding protein [Actinomycetes bacterium]